MNLKEKSGDWLPEKIGNFKVIEILGMGGMGVIYKGIQQHLNRVVAIKVLPPQFSQNSESSLRFESEAKAISLLQHQNIVQLFEYGLDGDLRFFAMQYVDGENLASRIQKNRAMPLPEIIDFSKQICRGLRYAHSMNVIHRDIKPQNILIDKSNIARLTDFGIAKIMSQNDITVTGVTVGTPEYMSPEQAEGRELTIHTDIYSLGVVIYEMLTKMPPFTGNNPIAVAYKQVHEIPLPPSVKRKDTPKRLELIVLKALKKKRDDRHQTIEEMLELLDSVDLDDAVGRTTKVFAVSQEKQEEDKKNGLTEQRITDRRDGHRRKMNRNRSFLDDLRDSHYWLEFASANWPILILLAILYVIVLYHIGNHPGFSLFK
jgi:serine/threonine protein kinase